MIPVFSVHSVVEGRFETSIDRKQNQCFEVFWCGFSESFRALPMVALMFRWNLYGQVAVPSVCFPV